MTKREQLEAALAEAEAALAGAAIDLATIGVDRVEANANLEKTRGHCRNIRAALVKLSRSELVASSDERIDARIKQSGEASNREAGARPPSRQVSKHALRRESKSSPADSGQTKPSVRFNPVRFNIGLSARQSGRSDVPTGPPLLRQAIDLLILALAYLQYYYIDVQLQIANLPSTIVVV